MDNQADHPAPATEQICINTIRTLAMDAIQKANSGHPGAPMGLAAAAFVLWTRFLKHDPADPQWADRDRFVLSGGHASMLLYALLHLTGYDLSLEDLQNFRQWESKTPGHPEYGHTPGVETTTGPLGQGVANAVGMAMAERHLAARFNRPELPIVDHFTYVMCGDGDMMEGLAAEACSLAGHLKLGRLICLYDDNEISIEGPTHLTFSENVPQRFEALGWHVQTVADGNDVAAIDAAIRAAQAVTQQPSLIALKTQIAYGSPNKQGSSDAHGAPLGEEEVCLTKRCLGCAEDETFCIPEEAATVYKRALEKGAAAHAGWRALYEQYGQAHPEMATTWTQAQTGQLAAGWDKQLEALYQHLDPIATRAASGKALNAVAAEVSALVGGSADLAPSNKTLIAGETDYSAANYGGRNLRFGVREHAMGAIMNGMALHKGIRPFGGTFLVFADYMRPAIRLAALMQLPVIYVFTHDSIAVGEDGPTHQPVEHLASLRVIPGLTVLRPADMTETIEAWRLAMQSEGPVALILSRQKLAVLNRQEMTPATQLSQGAYVLSETKKKTQVAILSSGAEVHLALEVQALLEDRQIGTRVISVPSWDRFAQQPQAVRESVLGGSDVIRVAIEAGHPMGWERWGVATEAIVGISRFGASAPGNVVLKNFGFDSEAVVQRILDQLAGAAS